MFKGIFNPIWKTKDHKKRMEIARYMQSITDQNKLKKIVLEAPLFATKFIAVTAITDDRILMDIVAKETLSDIQAEAIKKIKDQKMLADQILNNVINGSLAEVALGCITDQNELLRIALGAGDKGIATMAGSKITDAELKKQLQQEPEPALAESASGKARGKPEQVVKQEPEKKIPEKRIPEKWEFLRFRCSECQQEIHLEDGYNETPIFLCKCGKSNQRKWQIVEHQYSIIDQRLTYVLICPVCYKLREYAGPSCHLDMCSCSQHIKEHNDGIPVNIRQSGW